jgi:hypothetical protein
MHLLLQHHAVEHITTPSSSASEQSVCQKQDIPPQENELIRPPALAPCAARARINDTTLNPLKHRILPLSDPFLPFPFPILPTHAAGRNGPGERRTRGKGLVDPVRHARCRANKALPAKNDTVPSPRSESADNAENGKKEAHPEEPTRS